MWGHPGVTQGSLRGVTGGRSDNDPYPKGTRLSGVTLRDPQCLDPKGDQVWG